ncbi:MAG TPA: serine hydrolase domain-containing protein [Streptosporangiaceae bacterium]|nr:serine hydrolase domain-containing protein [Streptosporangiaceae bacterium]
MAELDTDPSGADLAGADVSGADLAAVDRLAAAFAERAGQPGLAYGVVAQGRLVHAGGLGERWLGGPVPDAGTVFRIASMTKSFTAATVLLLRDEGALRLDDLAEDYVPEVRGLSLPSADSPRPALRHLLTMTGGFPTDDPWGDRQQGLPPAEFAALLRDGGVRLAWVPGTRFEYSNLGYAILGRVIEKVTGEDYAAAVRARILAPLGMTRTGFEAAEFSPDELARGYQNGAGGWAELTPDPYGAFAPMGGVFSTVADLARWVSGFAGAFPPGDPGTGGPHPLSRATRREMQLPQLAIITGPGGSFPGGAGISYGFGLFIEDDPAFGAVVQHSGGYPGYGSQMRWHQATGIGTIVLGNGTYAHAGALASRMLAELLGQLGAGPAGVTSAGALVRGPAPAGSRPWPETLAARAAADRLLQAWDDELAARLFTPNVEWDQPLAERQAAVGRIRERIGDFRPDPGRPAQYESPAHCRWWLRGERGVVQAEIGLAPLTDMRVQSLRVAVPPAADSVLQGVLDTLTGLVNDGAAEWPADLAVASDVDSADAARRLRVAGAWTGPCTVAAFRAGDGENSVTVELAGASGRADLAIAVDAASGTVRQVSVTLLS